MIQYLKKISHILSFKKKNIKDKIKSLLKKEEIELTNEQLHIIFNVIETKNYDVNQIKIPTNKMNTLSVASPLKKVIQTIKKTGHSRIPIYEEVDGLRKYVGILYAKNLFQEFMKSKKKEAFHLKNIMKPIDVVSEFQSIYSLIRDMRLKRTHLVLIANEYGEITGLITLEDLLEEIVGEIRDEFDPNQKLIKELEYRTYKIDASLPLTDINKELSLELHENEFNTLSGLYLHHVQGKLRKKKKIYYNNLELTLDNFTNNQIQTIILKISPIVK